MLIKLLTIFMSSFIIALSGAMMPGPLLTTTISESSQRGFVAGPLIIGGHAILEAVLIVALLMGLGSFLQQPWVFVATAIIGSVILFLMSCGMFKSLPSLNLDWDNVSSHDKNPVFSGFLMSIANPYWIIWWATIGLGYILYSWQFGLLGIIFFFAGHILADLAWYSFISAAVAGGRQFLTDRVYRCLIAICASFLVLFSGYFAFAGIKKFLNIINF